MKPNNLSTKINSIQLIRIAIAVGIIVGALVMHFLSSPERWIRL